MLKINHVCVMKYSVADYFIKDNEEKEETRQEGRTIKRSRIRHGSETGTLAAVTVQAQTGRLSQGGGKKRIRLGSQQIWSCCKNAVFHNHFFDEDRWVPAAVAFVQPASKMAAEVCGK